MSSASKVVGLSINEIPVLICINTFCLSLDIIICLKNEALFRYCVYCMVSAENCQLQWFTTDIVKFFWLFCFSTISLCRMKTIIWGRKYSICLMPSVIAVRNDLCQKILWQDVSTSSYWMETLLQPVVFSSWVEGLVGMVGDWSVCNAE